MTMIMTKRLRFFLQIVLNHARQMKQQQCAHRNDVHFSWLCHIIIVYSSSNIVKLVIQ